MQQEQGFTLVEIAITLLIIGLLTGGIMLGQDLIRSSHLQVVVASHGHYASAVKSFTEKYYALPGDIPNATTFWAASANGDGNGKIDSASNEMFRFWEHLKLAELVEGSFTGVNAGTASLHKGGENSPKTDILNATWGARYADNSASATEFQVLLQNYLSFGIPNATNGFPDGNTLSPPEAFSIDDKVDDGKPGTGKVIAVGGYATCTNAANSADFAATYLATESPLCALAFKGDF